MSTIAAISTGNIVSAIGVLRLFYPLLCVFAFLCIGMYFVCRKIYRKPVQ